MRRGRKRVRRGDPSWAIFLFLAGVLLMLGVSLAAEPTSQQEEAVVESTLVQAKPKHHFFWEQVERAWQAAWQDFCRKHVPTRLLPGRSLQACLPSSSSASKDLLTAYILEDSRHRLIASTAHRRRGRSRPAADDYNEDAFSCDNALEIFVQQDKACRETKSQDDGWRSTSSRDVPPWPLEPHIGMVLEVYKSSSSVGDELWTSHDEPQDMEIEVAYELIEPLELELGLTVKHAADFAYAPVLTAGTEAIRVTSDSLAGRDDADSGASLEYGPHRSDASWWQWWIPWWRWDGSQDHSSQYRMHHSAFAGGSHGEVWRGRRRCKKGQQQPSVSCTEETLIFKKMKIEIGYRVLEAGLREVYFGSLLAAAGTHDKFTTYVDHFFRERWDREPELWIVFRPAGVALRSFVYTGTVVGDFLIYQHSPLWTHLRRSVSNQPSTDNPGTGEGAAGIPKGTDAATGRHLLRRVLRQIFESVVFLHHQGIVHRDIKPSNIMCQTDLDPLDELGLMSIPSVQCVLGDFSSAWNKFTDENLYTGGPSRAEQTDEYAPPESFLDTSSPWLLSPAFDSWSIGIVILELLLGTPNVFSVDQRTKAILTHKLKMQGASEKEIERALYLAALSQFCIYNPQSVDNVDWPLRSGDPLHQSAMVKDSCTLHDFHRALRVRDPLGIGFDSSADQLLLLVWRLLAWDPSERITPREALRHPYFSAEVDFGTTEDEMEDKALESLMLDPRLDFNLTDVVDDFTCPSCGRVFRDWKSCSHHAIARKHAKFCTYDHGSLPTCLNAHSMLPAHIASGYCDIQGRRRTIEDMHAVELTSTEQIYGIFDGHTGNRASKYAASFLFPALKQTLAIFVSQRPESMAADWLEGVTRHVEDAFRSVHAKFIDTIALVPQSRLDQSGTTATIAFVTANYVILASLGDSRAIISSKIDGKVQATQLTRDHTASDLDEKAAVEARGGTVVTVNGVDRVNGQLVVTRSLGDARLSPFLSQTPDVMPFTRTELLKMCGELEDYTDIPCFLILASDGLWDVVSNNEAIDLVVETILDDLKSEKGKPSSTALQKAAEALVHEAFIRGSSDNIGVCVVAISEGFGTHD